MSRLFKSKKRGIALFVAVITSSVLFLIAIAISDMAFREVKFSIFGRDSKKAFYAANSGMECALMLKLGPGESCGGRNSLAASPAKNLLNFGDQCADVVVLVSGPNTTITSYGYNTCNTSGRRIERAIRVTY